MMAASDAFQCMRPTEDRKAIFPRFHGVKILLDFLCAFSLRGEFTCRTANSSFAACCPNKIRLQCTSCHQSFSSKVLSPDVVAEIHFASVTSEREGILSNAWLLCFRMLHTSAWTVVRRQSSVHMLNCSVFLFLTTR